MSVSSAMRSSSLLGQTLAKTFATRSTTAPRPITKLLPPRPSILRHERRISLHSRGPSNLSVQTAIVRSVPSAARTSTFLCARPFITVSKHRKDQTITAKQEATSLETARKESEEGIAKEPEKAEEDLDELDHEAEERGFGRSEKAAQAQQINLSARLSKDRKDSGKGLGLGETWRLIKIARPEAGVLAWAFAFLLVSSSISMTIPFSIGKFLDVATNQSGVAQLYGFDLSTLYLALGGILVLGAGANYGRILILRIVGERIVSRLRSQLFRRTYVQNAEFFDANRVGDLISRLSSDTVIVGKSITQNLSDGLRSLVSGAAGLVLMGFVSLKLTSVLAICMPPVAVATVVFGRTMRSLSRKIQKNLGTLTKIAEERLGNVKTSQSFAGEILEVSRYNTQVKKLFGLGRREAFITATYFSAVSRTSATMRSDF